MKKYLNSRGSALILVMSAIIVLTAVTATAVMLSAANIKMSKKYSNWSSEYYNLDYAVEQRLADVDKNALLKAENLAREYLINGTFTEETASVESSIQTVHYELYDEWYYGIEQPLKAAEAADPALFGSDAEYAAYLMEAEDVYDQEMRKFIPQAFGKLYLAYVNGKVNEYIGADYENDPDGIITSVNWTNPGAYEDDHRITLLAQEEDTGDNPSRKQVEAVVTIISPSYDAVTQIQYSAVRVNPLYTNALSVNGDISFTGSGSVRIAGDVVSSSSGHHTNIVEDNNNGIKTLGPVSVGIFGNVYSAGDVHLLASNSSIKVEPYNGPGAPEDIRDNYHPDMPLRQRLFGNGASYNFYLQSIGSEALAYSNTQFNGLGSIPYIYADTDGGNVYCNNLAIGNDSYDVVTGTLSAAGSVWTQDDVQNDGKGATSINIGGTYIGMNSTSDAYGDPNGSSAVINNAFPYGGSIALGDQCVIPGLVYFEYEDDKYYRTAESATAQAGEFFTTYVYDPTKAGGLGLNPGTYTIGDQNFTLYSQAGFGTADWVKKFAGIIKGLHLDSNIDVNPSSYYSLGVMIGNGSVLYDETEASENLLDYKDVSNGNILTSIFAKKTRYFGTDGFTFDGLTNDSGVHSDPIRGFYYYSSAHATINDLDALGSGIIYAAGDLTINGGTFRGSIICEGDLTIKGGTTVIYDENAIMKTIWNDINGDGIVENGEGSRIARRFFTPSGYTLGSVLATEKVETISTSAGERDIDAVRYNINKWEEGPAA